MLILEDLVMAPCFTLPTILVFNGRAWKIFNLDIDIVELLGWQNLDISPDCLADTNVRLLWE
jgi:hypothetical protein